MDNRFENKLVETKAGMVHASRIISSFMRMGFRIVKNFPFGSYPANKIFFEYLDYIGVSKEDQDSIWLIASNGKSELESLASKFLDEKYKGHEENYRPRKPIAGVDD